MNFSLNNSKLLEINYLMHLDNYLPDYQTNVKHIITVASSIIFTLLIIGIISIIVAAILSQSLCLFGLLTTICLLIPVMVVAYLLLNKYSHLSYNTQNLSLDAVTNFSIKEKTDDSFTVTVHLNNDLSKEIVFVSQPFSQVLQKLSHPEQNLSSRYSPTGYVFAVDKNGSILYPFENKACFQEIQAACKSAQSPSPFSVGQTNSAIIFTEKPSTGPRADSNFEENSDQRIDSSLSIPEQSTNHSYLFLTYPYKPMESLASFCESLKTSYKNIFNAAAAKNIKVLYLPLLGINPKIIVDNKTKTYKKIFDSKIFLQIVFEEIKKQSSIEKVVVFIDKNSMIEEILYSKLAIS